MKNYSKKFLIANSIVTDPVFSGKVVFIFNHFPQGAEGVILNAKEIGKVGFMELLDNAPEEFDEKYAEFKKMVENNALPTCPLYSGGPCETPSLFFIHGYDEFVGKELNESEFDLGIPNSFDEDNNNDKFTLIEGAYLGSPFTFANIIQSGKVSEGKFKFYLGRSLWGEGQLEKEIEAGAWKVVDANGKMFFDDSELIKLTKSAKSHSWIPFVPSDFDVRCN